jgi:hypothetical protein
MHLAAQAGLKRVWPVLLEIIEKGDDPAMTAVETAVQLLGENPEDPDMAECAADLAEVLGRLVEKGVVKTGWDSRLDYVTPIIAADGLGRLGDPHPQVVIAHALGFLKLVTVDTATPKSSVSTIRGPLRRAIPQVSDDERAALVGELRTLAQATTRIPGWDPNTLIAEDTLFRLALQDIIAEARI